MTPAARSPRRSGGRRAPYASDDPRQGNQRPAAAEAPPANTKEAIVRVDELMATRHAQLMALVGGSREIVDRLRAVTLHALANPRLAEKLQRADLATVIEAVREAAIAGLMPTGANGDGWLVPYWNKDKSLYDIQFQAGYRGQMKLLEPTCVITSGAVYAADHFEFMKGSEEWVRHVPALVERGERIAFWAAAWIKDAHRSVVEVMTIPEIEQRRRASKAADDGPWIEWYDEMGRKTVIRAIEKRVPKTDKAERLMAYEDEAEERYTLAPGAAAPITQLGARDRARALLSGPVAAPGPGAVAADAPQGSMEAPGSLPPKPTDADVAAIGRGVSDDATPAQKRAGRQALDRVNAAAAREICGAESDPPVQICIKDPDHLNEDGSRSSHQAEDGSAWPNPEPAS